MSAFPACYFYEALEASKQEVHGGTESPMLKEPCWDSDFFGKLGAQVIPKFGFCVIRSAFTGTKSPLEVFCFRLFGSARRKDLGIFQKIKVGFAHVLFRSTHSLSTTEISKWGDFFRNIWDFIQHGKQSLPCSTKVSICGSLPGQAGPAKQCSSCCPFYKVSLPEEIRKPMRLDYGQCILTGRVF